MEKNITPDTVYAERSRDWRETQYQKQFRAYQEAIAMSRKERVNAGYDQFLKNLQHSPAPVTKSRKRNSTAPPPMILNL